MTDLRPRPLRRRLLVLVALALALAVIERGVGWWFARAAAPAHGAEWIWSHDPPSKTAPRAFWAAVDFEVHRPASGATLAVLADEEYIVYLNGRRIGSGVYRPGADLDVYAVDEALLEGVNRLLLELRCGRGSGGALVGLEDGDGRALAASGGHWRIFREPDPGLRGGWSSLDGGEEPRVWGAPPVGRWGSPRRGELARSFTQMVASAPIRAGAGAETRQAVSGTDGPWTVWDFGREVEGYLEVDFGPATVPAAMVYLGNEVPVLDPGTAADSIMLPKQASVWPAARPHRTRYVVVVGRRQPVAVVLWPLSESASESLPPPPEPPTGLLGVEPPESLPAVEAWVRERLKENQ